MKYLLSVICGLFLGYYTYFNIGPNISFVKFIFLSGLVGGIFLFIKRKDVLLKNILSLWVILCVSFCFGFSYVNIRGSADIVNKNFEETLVVKDINSNLDGSKVILHSKNLNKNILINVYAYQNINLIPGDIVTVSGELQSDKVIYPKRNNNDWESFDYFRYLKSKNIDFILNVKTIKQNVTHETILNRVAYKIRTYFYDNLKAVMTNENAGVVLAMTLGDDRGVTKDIKDSFRNSGLSHVLVFSGFNFSVLVGVISVLVLSFSKRSRVLLVIIASLLIFILAPASAPTARAGIFVFYGLLAEIFNKSYNIKFIFYIFILLYALFNPVSASYNSSFHLSVLAVGTIIYSDQLINLFTQNKVKQYLLMIFFIFLTTTPYTAYMFGGVSLFSILSNALSLPIVSVITVAGLVTMVLSSVSITLGSILGYILNILVDILISVSKLFGVSLNNLNINLSFIVFYYLIIIFLYNFLVFHFQKHRNYN